MMMPTMARTRTLLYHPSIHLLAQKLHAAIQIHHHSLNLPRAILLTTTTPLLHHPPTFPLTSLQLSLPLHLHILPLHSSHHHVSQHHAHVFLNHGPRAHSHSIRMDNDHVPDSPPHAIVAHHGRLDTMIATTIAVMIGVAHTGAVLLILADIGNVDADHIPDGTPATVAVHILGDTTLAHANGSQMTHPLPRNTTAPPILPLHVPALAIQLTTATDHTPPNQHHAPIRTPHQAHLLPRLLPWYCFRDLVIDHFRNLHILLPHQRHDLLLHHKHFNHLLQFHHKVPFHLLKLRNFDNFAFNFNTSNKLLTTYNNRPCFTLLSILFSLLSNSTFLQPFPLPQLHRPTHRPAQHPPLLLHLLQNQHQLPLNPPTFQSLFSPPGLPLPIRQIPPITLLGARLDQRPHHACQSTGLATAPTLPLWNTPANWATSWTMEVAIEVAPQKFIWTTPFWLRIRLSGPTDVWYEIFDHKFQDWSALLSMVNKFRRSLIEDIHRPCSWEECEAPEPLPRTLVDTTIHELLKLEYPKTDYFQDTQATYTFVHNCPGVSLRGILTDGIIRPSTWKGDGKSHSTDFFPSLGFYCRCCYPGHSHDSDNRINSDITHQLTPELQCALHVASLHGGRTSGRRYFVAGECFSRQFQHYVVRQGGLPCDSIASHFYDVVRNRSDSRYKCRSSTGQVQYAGLFIRTDELTSYGLRRSDIPL